MGDNYDEFCKSAENVKNSGRGLSFFYFRKKPKYDSEGFCSYGVKITHLDLKRKTIQNLGHGSVMNRNHYIHAAHMFKICYDFHEVFNPCDLIHIEHLSYDDHT